MIGKAVSKVAASYGWGRLWVREVWAPDSTGMKLRSLRAAEGCGIEQGQPAGWTAGGQAQKVGGRDVGLSPRPEMALRLQREWAG